MNDLHSKAVDDVANLSKEGTSLYNPRTKKLQHIRVSILKDRKTGYQK